MPQLNMPDPHPHQAEILKSEARFRVVTCGRRFGKTYIGIRAILIRAIQYDQACWWLAPTYDMADHVWRELKSVVRDFKNVRISESDLRMDFSGGGWIAIHSTHTPDHLRGAGLDFVVLDEAAFMSPDIWPEIVRPMLVERRGSALFLSSPNGKNWFYNLYQMGLNAAPVQNESFSPLHLGEGLGVRAASADKYATFDSVGTPYMASADELPTLDFVGAVRETSSLNMPDNPVGTPYMASVPVNNVSTLDLTGTFRCLETPLWDETPSKTQIRPLEMAGLPDTSFSPLHLGEGPGVRASEWRSFHFPTAVNPLISPDELAAIRAETAERVWLEEYEAEFTEDVGQVFRGIQEAATAPVAVEPVPDTRYVVGLDWGRENDYTAIVVMDAEHKTVVATDRFNQVSWSLQRGRLKAICDRWQPVVIYAESNSIGSPNIEALQSEGLPIRPFNTTATTKPPLIEALSLAIERQEIALQPDENLLAELATYKLERLPAGGYRYSAPLGLHDDLVIALALSWYAARHSGLPISFA